MPEEFVNEDGSPATLTPEQQADAVAKTAQAQAQTPAQDTTPEAQVLPYYQSPQYVGDDDKPLFLSPAQQLDYRKKAGLVDPLKDLSPEDMVALARQTADDPEKKFDIFSAWKSREEELKNDPQAVHNVAKAWRLYKDSTGLGDMANPIRMGENAVKGVADLVTSTAKLGWNLMQPEVQDPNSLNRDITPEVRRNLTEAKIGQKLAGMGLANQASAAVNKLARTWTPASSFTGGAALPASPPTPTQETDQDGLFYDSAKADDMAALIRGEGSHSLKDIAQGGGMPAESQHNLDLIKQAGLSLRPDEIQKYASGSPLTYYLFGKLFGAAGKVLPGVPQEALTAAGTKLAQVTGKGITATAKAAESVPPVVAPFVKPAAAIGGAFALPTHPILGALAGWREAGGFVESLLKAGPKLEKVGEAGKQIAGEAEHPITNAYTQLAKSIIENTPAAAYEAGKGYLFDLATAATAETPDEAKNVGLGTFFGLMGAGRALGVPALTGLLTGKRGYGLKATPAPTGFYPGFEKLQTDAIGSATKGQAARANYLIDAAQKLPNSEGVFVGPQPTDQIKARAQQLLDQSQTAATPVVEPATPEPGATPTFDEEQAAQQKPTGPLTPEQARVQATVEVDPFARQLVAMGLSPENATTYANQDGGSVHNFQGHDLYYFRDPDAAPHEVAGHGWEGLLGESVMRAFDRQIQNDPKYGGPNWDNNGKRYARRMGWDEESSPESWQDYLLRNTGFGITAAKEKVARQLIGQGPLTSDDLETNWQTQVAKNEGNENATWKNTLTPAEQNEVANRYVSREIYAENEDTAFKHRGGYVDTDKSLPARIARTVGAMVSYMGIDPVQGAQAEYSKWPLSYDLMRGVAKTRAQVTKGLPVTAPNAPAARGFRLGGIATPATPEDRQKAQQAAAGYAAEAPNIPGVRGGRTIHSLLGQLWQSMVKNIPVKIDHSGAVGDPAASPSASLKGRQAETEVQRYVPENLRQQVEKIATVEQIIKTSEGEYQVQVWDNNVPYANGWREAQRYQRAVAKDPANVKLIPQGLSLDDTGNWTPESWEKLHQAIQIGSKNYAAGRTAGGMPLETSEFAKSKGQWVPSLGPSAGTLPDDMAGLVSALFGFEVPESTRMTKNMRIPANVAAQELRAQTLIKAGKRPDLPLPTPESPEFGAETTTPAQQRLAEEAGVTGRHILDLNPQRRALNEALGEKSNLIPAVQRLNVERIKDVTDLPEQFPLRGRSTAIQAGFQPPREAGAANPADELKPALRDSEGKIYPGQVGKTHADIYESQPTKMDRLMLTVAQPEHGFLRGDEFLNRQQAAEHVGETKPLQSERLRELQTPPSQTGAPSMQFQPSKDQRAIRTAAVRDQDTGTDYEGPSHFDAYGKALDAGVNLNTGNLKSGFLTHGGEFLSPDEAHQRAQEMGQLGETPGRTGLASEDLRGGAQFAPAREESEGFRKWTAGTLRIPPDSPKIHEAVTGKPTVITGYHGTTKDFSTFDPSKGEVEGRFGKGIYVTTGQADVGLNYAGFGPDLRNKITREAERMSGMDPRDIMREYSASHKDAVNAAGSGYDNPVAERLAKKKFAQHGGATMKVYVKLENPLVLGGKGEPYWDYDFDEKTGQESGPLTELHRAINEAAATYGVDNVPLPDEVMEGGKASKVIDALRKSESFMGVTDDQGNLAGHEIIRDAIERMGYDGIIDRTVDQNFGSQKRIGGQSVGMLGMNPDVAHIVAFRPEQVKSATANRGTFDPTNSDIRFQPPRPNDKREQIESAAIRLPSGKIFTGPIHTLAYENAAENEGHDALPSMEDSDFGFTTTHGRFVDRITAADIAKKAHQLVREPSYDVGPSGERQLDTYDIRGANKREGIPLDAQAQPPRTYIVRHGSTELNADDPHKDKIRGFINVPLSNEGKKEANATADELKDSGIKTIITSDLTRARQTANAIAKTTGAKVVEDPRLRPWHFGSTIEGKPTDKMLPVIKSYVEQPDKKPPGGESFNEFKDRFLGAFHDAQDNYPDEHTAIVTHYRGTKLLDAWRETGTDNDTISRAVFEDYDADKKPGSYDVVDKTGAQFQAPKEEGRDKQAAAEDFFQRVTDHRNAIMHEFLGLPESSDKEISWNRVPAARLKRIWLDYGKSGVLRDEKGIETIADQVLDNIARIKAVTELVGHEDYSVEDQLKEDGISLTPKQWERFYDSSFITDQFSDYGMKPLESLYDKLYRAETPEEKLHLVDRVLNVVHQRGDLAEKFVEGGTKTLNEIASQGGYSPKETEPNSQYQAPKNQEKENSRIYEKRSATHGWWMNPQGDLLPLTTGEHATDAIKILGIPASRQEKNDAYGQTALKAYHELTKRGWRAILPQTFFRSGEPVSTLLYRGGEETPDEAATSINKAQRAALEKLAIKHDLVINNNLGDSIYRPPTAPAQGEEPTILGRSQFQAPKEAGAEEWKKSGLAFKDFFSQATRGEIGKSKVPWTPIMDLDKETPFAQEQSKHTGNFDEHIAKSIPGFKETQIRTGSAIVKTFGKGADMLDIAASEGSYAKTISALSKGKIKTVSLDPNPDMADFFQKKSEVPGATYDTSAFLNGFEDNGKQVPAYDPDKTFDVVHESMGFQFISPERAEQIAEAKRLMKPDGVFLTEEKVTNPNWDANEAKKDTRYKNKYFSGEELAKKNKVVGFQQSEQETQKVGMIDNMVSGKDLESVLRANFDHVTQYWDSGNFRGYAASDDPAVLGRLVKNMGDLKTDFSTLNTPRDIAKPTTDFHALGAFDKRGNLQAALNPSGGYASHALAGVSGEHPWTYDARRHTVNWSEGVPEEVNQRAVRAWLKERGYPVASNEQTPEGFQFQPPPFQDKNFDRELADIRSGKSGGATFNRDGTTWQSENRDEHLASLFSVNLPLGALNRKNVEAAIQKHFPLLDEPNIKPGIFAFSKDGVPTVSIDLNSVIPNKFIENSKRFAKQNDQISIWDTSLKDFGDEVKTGGKGNTRLQNTDELLDAHNSLQQGLPTDVDDIIKENRITEVPGHNAVLPGMGAREEKLSPQAASRLSNAEAAEYYPESVKPKTMPRNSKGEKVDEVIPSRITESPLYKAAGGGPEAEKSFGRKLAEFAKEWIEHPSFQSGLKWYSEFVPMLKKEFGKYHPIMAELLAGTSPNETPDSNFAMAVDALEGYKSGRFDKQIAKFEEGLDMLKSDAWQKWAAKNKKGDVSEAGFLKAWVDAYDLKPRKANGKLYGMSSDAVMKIFARKWIDNTSGLKTQQFIKNLLGIQHDATIDLWADRTMRRIGYSGFRQRWRILPKNGDGVSDADFLFSQAAFRHAAKELGITPDALQGGLWFAEKQLWADRGYGKLDLGDFREEIKKLGMLKEGVKQSLAAQKKAAKVGAEEQPDLLVTPRNLKK